MFSVLECSRSYVLRSRTQELSPPHPPQVTSDLQGSWSLTPVPILPDPSGTFDTLPLLASLITRPPGSLSPPAQLLLVPLTRKEQPQA